MTRYGLLSTMLLLLVVGAVLGYVSPDDQGRSKSGSRARFEQAPPGQSQRQRPQPLSAYDQERLEQARRGAAAGAAARRARDIDTGSGYSGAGAGSASYAGASGGAGAGFYPGYQPNPFMQANNFELDRFFQQLRHTIGQFALNQAAFTQSFFERPQSSSDSSGNQGHFDINDLQANLPPSITLKNGTVVPIAALLDVLSGSSPTSSQHHHSVGGHGGGQGFDVNAFNQIGGNVEGASASASLTPEGGYGQAQLISGLGNRFGESGQSGQSGPFAPPSGGNFGVFTSSSAGSSDVNGQRQTFKTATSGVNDNGKITTYTVRDP